MLLDLPGEVVEGRHPSPPLGQQLEKDIPNYQERGRGLKVRINKTSVSYAGPILTDF